MSSLRGVFFLIILSFFSFNLFASPSLSDIDEVVHITERDIVLNSNIVSDASMKKITPAEYVTDPVILYAGLWLTLGLNIPLRGEQLSFMEQDGENSFTERMAMEPFTQAKGESIISPLKYSDGSTVRDANHNIVHFPNGNFFAMYLMEPAMFSTFTLYLRSKNYHPALIIGEIFTLSLLYEFTVRPFFMNANFEQLLKNPAAGLLAGFILDEFSSYLLTTPYMGLHVLGYILNPFKLLPTRRVYPLLFFQPYNKAIYFEVSVNP